MTPLIGVDRDDVCRVLDKAVAALADPANWTTEATSSPPHRGSADSAEPSRFSLTAAIQRFACNVAGDPLHEVGGHGSDPFRPRSPRAAELTAMAWVVLDETAGGLGMLDGWPAQPDSDGTLEWVNDTLGHQAVLRLLRETRDRLDRNA